MKPGIVADEMFPEGTSAIMDLDDETGSNVIFEMNEKSLQADFYNDFNDLNDDDDF
ncbi:COP9 signalosome complex subunit 9 [Rhopalosiphum maidis]|uniref:COP9 signalosome complex subunit 9 n=1 Tax=Rhopalosiphum maidis TaxID=43146 RepID=UPI000EFE6240|nr:COP9 signalosome complex subunit 9 [Rhopalosiphum maidis]